MKAPVIDPGSDEHFDLSANGTHMCEEAFLFFCQEALESPSGLARIPAHLLRKRLPEALRRCEEHHRKAGLTEMEDIEPYLELFRNFVGNAESIELETGRAVVIGITSASRERNKGLLPAQES